nr:hypothetical protein [Microvirga sp. HBU65207]
MPDLVTGALAMGSASRFMPMPLSSIVRRRFSASISSVIRVLGSSPSRAGWEIAS